MDRKELQTPCYIVHKDLLEEGISLLKNSLEKDWNKLQDGMAKIILSQSEEELQLFTQKV